MLEPEVYEKLMETLEEIREESEGGLPILVEGKKDETALRKLDVKGPVYQVPEKGKTLLNSIESLSSEERVIVLTDFDEQGEKLANFCERHLEKLGTEVDLEFREDLKSYLRKGVKDIEGMARFVRSEEVLQEGDADDR